MPNNVDDIVDKLSREISDDVGNTHEDELDAISSDFDQYLAKALKAFNSSAFDDDGFVAKIRDLDLGDAKDKEVIKNVLNNLAADYVNADTLNQSELLLRRDLANICSQMPEMQDVVKVIRDSIIECNVSTGDVSRSLIFENQANGTEAYEAQVREIENRHDLQVAIKNFIIPNALRVGEMYVHVVPYAKLFAELEAIGDQKNGMGGHFKESVPTTLLNQFHAPITLNSDENVKFLTEAVDHITKEDISSMAKTANPDASPQRTSAATNVSAGISKLLENIDVYNASSEVFAEAGSDGFKEFLIKEYAATHKKKSYKTKTSHFQEAMDYNTLQTSDYSNIDQDDVNIKEFSDIKGCYVKYLDTLRLVPIRIDRRVIGYYYISTTMDLQTTSAQPNGFVDLSFQQYTRDKNLVDRLADIIIKSFDKKMLEKNIRLKNEIAEIIMAHKFSEGKLSFIYIPEDEVVRFTINEDAEGKGHSVLEPTMFPARMYLMLTLYNALYILNNNTTRVHYLKSSGLNKNYAAQIQRTMRKFQSRRITIDDIYSYQGVLNKVGGMGEMVLPAGRNDYKALETDTIGAVENPINMEFLEQQRRQAISGTGVPHLLVINAIDEVDFAKTLEMANTRFLSTVSSYKIDFNKGLTKLYRKLMKYETSMEDDVINSFKFKFNAVTQKEVEITNDMIANFNALCELVGSLYYKKSELEDRDGNPTPLQMILRKRLAKKYMPQLDFDELEEVIGAIDLDTVDDQLQRKVTNLTIDNEDINEFDNGKPAN